MIGLSHGARARNGEENEVGTLARLGSMGVDFRYEESRRLHVFHHLIQWDAGTRQVESWVSPQVRGFQDDFQGGNNKINGLFNGLIFIGEHGMKN